MKSRLVACVFRVLGTLAAAGIHLAMALCFVAYFEFNEPLLFYGIPAIVVLTSLSIQVRSQWALVVFTTLAGPLIVAVILCAMLLSLGLEFEFSQLSLAYGLPIFAVFLFIVVFRPRQDKPPEPGCLLLLGLLLLCLLTAGAAHLMASPEVLARHSRALAGLALVFSVAYIAWMMVEAYYYQEHLRPRLERDLGFQYEKCLEQITISRLQPGGVLDQAGAQERDIVIDGLSITGFFRNLENARGKDPITLTVVPWSAAFCQATGGRRRRISIDNRLARTLTFRVPRNDSLL